MESIDGGIDSWNRLAESLMHMPCHTLQNRLNFAAPVSAQALRAIMRHSGKKIYGAENKCVKVILY